MDITASGNANTALTAKESGYSNVIESDMVLGVVPEFEYEEGFAVDDVVLNFDIEDSFTDNTNGKYAAVSDDFEGIKRFNVFKYFEEYDMLMPIETTYDLDNNKVITHVDELGTYCLVDMEKWFDNIGVAPDEFKSVVLSPSPVAAMGIPVNMNAIGLPTGLTAPRQKKIDVIVGLDYVQYFLPHFNKYSMKSMALKFGEDLFGTNENTYHYDLHVYVADDLTGQLISRNYASNYEEYQKLIDQVYMDPIFGSYGDIEDKLSHLFAGLNNRTHNQFYVRAVNGDLFIGQYTNDGWKRKYGVAPDGRMAAVGEPAPANDIYTAIDYFVSYIMKTSTSSSDPDNSNPNSGNNNNNQNSNSQNQEYTIIIANKWKKVKLDAPITDDYKKMIDGITPVSEFNFDDYADTDGDGLIDLREIRYSFNGEDVIKWDSDGNVILPTIKECRKLTAGKAYLENALSQYGFWDWIKINKIRILPIYSDPTEKDSDHDDFEDSIDPDKLNYNTITIDDNLLDDSGSIDGTNPQTTEDELKEKMIGHVNLGPTEVYSGDDIDSSDISYKNELIFTRTRKSGISDAKFSITPSMNSDFAITITNTEETMPEGEYSTDDFNSTVRVSYNKGKNKVEPVEINLSDDGTEITYVFALEKDKKYNISVNNPTNNHEGEYEIYVSEDNWEYAKYGGVRNIEEKNNAYEECYRTVYLSDEAFYLMVKNYYDITLTENNCLNDAPKEDLLIKEIGACQQNLEHVMWVLYGYDEFMARIGKKDSLKDIFKGYNPTGDLLSLAGIIVTVAVAPEIATPVGIAISVIGIGYSIGNQYAEYMIGKYENDIVKAMFEGNYNISFTKHHHLTNFVLDVPNETITESVEEWKSHNYINKYMGIQRGDVMAFKLYELQVDGEAFSVIPKL